VSVPWSAASALPRRAPTRKQARTPIDVTSSPPGSRDANNRARQEPATEQNQQERSNCHQPSGAMRSCNQWLGAVRNCQEISPIVSSCKELSPTVRSCREPSGTVINCHEGGPPILFIGNQCGRNLKQTSAKSTLPIGASVLVTNRQPHDHSFLARARCNTKSTQDWLTMPCLGCWTNGRKQPFARITEQNREALTKRQQQPSPLCPARHKQEPASVHRAAERGVKRRWKKVDVKHQ